MWLLSVVRRSKVQRMSDLAQYEATRLSIEEAVNKLKGLLQTQRDLVLPHQHQHTYEDKFLLMESVVNCTVARWISIMKLLGMSDEVFNQALEIVMAKKLIKLRAVVKEECKFVREETKEVESSTSIVEVSGHKKKETKFVQKITTYFWDMRKTISFFLVAGHLEVPNNNELALTSRSVEFQLKSSTNDNPRAGQVQNPTKMWDIDISFLFDLVKSDNRHPGFRINRGAPTTYTPGYNESVKNCLDFSRNLLSFACDITNDLSDISGFETEKTGIKMSAVLSDLLQSYPPVAPVLEKQDENLKEISVNFFHDFVTVFDSAINSCVNRLPAELGQSKNYFEIKLILDFLERSVRDFHETVNYIRGLIASQLVDAIGKIVKIQDINEFAIFHHKRFFQPAFTPKALSFDIRRPGFTPEGVFTIDFEFANEKTGSAQQIATFQRTIKDPPPLKLVSDLRNEVY